MNPISSTELNEMLIERSTLLDVNFDSASHEAIFRFALEYEDEQPASVVSVHCKDVFQIAVKLLHGAGLSLLRIDGTPRRNHLVEFLAVFKDQHIFEWSGMEYDTPFTPFEDGSHDALLLSYPVPDSPHRGMVVFKDTNRSHFQLYVIGRELLLSFGKAEPVSLDVGQPKNA